ncbi:MAG: nicotinate (nicotinamide) nucleotide adenylyltransferase [Clostridia bacterium]|nr:nicotinate (nicotinamide) nucleotide adenylyltransferase [Clostridia bacterium]
MPKKDKIAVFGGTFNPPHCGHVHLLHAFSEQMHFDKILIIPTALPPHKQAKELAAPAHRLAMCRLAFEDAEICDIEIKNGGRNYTADTLEAVKKMYPQSELYFIMGTDMLLSFGSWYEPERILQNAILLCDARDAKTDAAALRRFAHEQLHLTDAQCIISDVLPLEISSSEVRARIKARESISGLVPPAVEQYILKEGLYVGKD